jgi:hypothetical protein
MIQGNPGEHEDELVEEETGLTELGVAQPIGCGHICLIEADDLVVLEELVLVSRQRGYGRFKVTLHVFDVEHVRDQLFVFCHLHEALGDHREVLLFNFFP